MMFLIRWTLGSQSSADVRFGPPWRFCSANFARGIRSPVRLLPPLVSVIRLLWTPSGARLPEFLRELGRALALRAAAADVQLHRQRAAATCPIRPPAAAAC
jgi:hypothetical protein